jgi:proteasome lid subunit RPN8/RPN11
MLRLTTSVRDAILDHAREGAPREVCGVLGGTRGGWPTEDRGDDRDGHTHASTALRAENVAEQPRSRYELDPAEQLRLMEEIEEGGEAVVGFYHSHPSGPEGPSATDAAQAAWEGYSYVICSLAVAPSVGSWRWTGEGFEREEVVVDTDEDDAAGSGTT